MCLGHFVVTVVVNEVLRVQGSGFRVSGFRVRGSRFRV